jgi:hypothetical protein
MTNHSTTSLALHSEAESKVLLDDRFDPIEAGLRGRVCEFIQAMIVSNGKQSGPRIGMEKRPRTGVGIGLSR